MPTKESIDSIKSTLIILCLVLILKGEAAGEDMQNSQERSRPIDGANTGFTEQREALPNLTSAAQTFSGKHQQGYSRESQGLWGATKAKDNAVQVRIRDRDS
mmetsp:Transcript_9340/g.15077  ORF Transcript_9340/g.15077 Transcript_9340/m.15077 type:complete len:102 (-) Transcript_9340:480-785(-)